MQPTTRSTESGDFETRIQDLLDRWEDARESGDEVSVETLCESCPELRTELESRIRELREIDGFIADTERKPPGNEETLVVAGKADELQGTFGQFEILGMIAQGGMGAVYRARQRTPERIVALKVIRSGERSSDHEMRRFHAEAEAAAKLSHPGIVPVYEVGEQDGRHYFTMEFVDGRSLAEVVRENSALDSRSAAETMLAVAEAVQFAHERGVVHRDIKPANVLIDVRNRPRVTDFGIAKQLEVDTALTATGQILGTPEYMSPEQARGHQGEIGTRSDIFSLGVTLYALLTGRSPFRDEDVYSTLRKVIEDDPPSPRSINSGVDRDLATICLKCLRKEPAERYPSAQALADDLQSYLRDEPISARPMSRGERAWRWCRRNPLLATTAAIALALLLALAIGGPLMAVHQRNLADRADRETDKAKVALENEQVALKKERLVTSKLKASLEKNEQTIYQFVKFTRDRRLLQDPRFRPVLKAFLQQALAHYQRFIADNKDDQSPVMRNRLGGALGEVADINYQQGSVEESIKAHRQALSIYQSLAREFPTNGKYQKSVADIRYKLSRLLRETGQLVQAIAEIRRVLNFHERRVKKEPGAVEHVFNRAVSHAELARVHQAMGKPREALAAFQQSRKLLETLVATHPDDAEYQLRLGEVYNNMGRLYRITGRPSEALKMYRPSLKIARKLVQKHPRNTTYQAALAAAQNNIGIVLNLTGKVTDALAEYQQAAVIQERLMREDPTVTRYQKGLANSLNHIAIIYDTKGMTNQALATYQRALTIQERLVRENPTVTKMRSDLADFHYNVCLLYQKLTNREKAIASGRKSLELRQQLARDVPTSGEYQYKRALSLNILGILYQQSGKSTESLKSHWECQAIWKRLAELNPKAVVYRSYVANSHSNIATVYWGQKRWTKAVDSYRRAIAIQGSLARAYPAAITYELGLAQLNFNISRALMGAKRMADALIYLNRAVSQFEDFRLRFPKSADYQHELMRSHWNRARVYDALGRHRKAIRDWRLAAALGRTKYRIYFESQLCRSLAHSGNYAEATNLATALANSLSDEAVIFGPVLHSAVGVAAIMKQGKLSHAERLYDLACTYAVSAYAAGRDVGLSSPQRRSFSGKYTSNAMELLNRSANAGFFKTVQNCRHLTVDRDLDSLRNRDDFQRFCRDRGYRSHVVARRPVR